MAVAIKPETNEKDLKVMETFLRAGHIEHKYAVRLQAVINRSKGIATNTVAMVLGIDQNSVSNYVKRYNEGGIESLLKDKTRKPGKNPIPVELKNKLTETVCREKPGDGTHWSTRELSRRFKISHTAVNTILRERNIKPHIVKRFQFSTDEAFDSKLADVVGLYLNPPENSIVFCVDEKTQIQALERTQPILPLRPGLPEGQTHDYERHGTTTLFAALNVASGEVIGKCKQSHKGEDYAEFLKVLDKRAPKKKVLHIIADNYSAHKAPEVKQYLAGKSGRFVEHFIPTYSSWLNMIERWFAEITNKRIRRESWKSIQELEKAITDYIISWNKTGRCFCWTKSFDDIKTSIEKVKAGLS
jgi:transposase